jgi:hypothetical protein
MCRKAKHSVTVLAYTIPLWLLVISQGCSQFQPAKFNRGEGVGADSILAIPFSEPRDHRWYCESERGERVVQAFMGWVQTNAGPNFPEGREVEAVLKTVRDWQAEEITSKDWQGITRFLGVKYVLIGEIEKVTLENPKAVGILEPSLQASYRVVNVELGRLAYKRDNFTLTLGRSGELDMPLSALGVDAARLQEKLLAKLGEELGKDLYGYWED